MDISFLKKYFESIFINKYHRIAGRYGDPYLIVNENQEFDVIAELTLLFTPNMTLTIQDKDLLELLFGEFKDFNDIFANHIIFTHIEVCDEDDDEQLIFKNKYFIPSFCSLGESSEGESIELEKGDNYTVDVKIYFCKNDDLELEDVAIGQCEQITV